MNESRFVANPSPLIFLAAIDALQLLPRLVDQVLFPEAILGEALAKGEPDRATVLSCTVAFAH